VGFESSSDPMRCSPQIARFL